jgi:hypothetical protein
MDIDKLKNKRQLNVQEQNALTQHYIEQDAIYFRRNKDLPQILLDYFVSRGIDLEQVSFDRMQYGGEVEGYRGLWLTRNHHFISYLIFLDETDSQIDEIDEWMDITDEIEVSAHARGLGNTYGQLCINALHKINHV